MVRYSIAIALAAAFALAPLAADAVQYDGIKNLTTAARTYTLSNPTQTVTIQPGQLVVIQDTQYTSSTQLINDVTSGYIGENVIGSPNATNLVYSQPVTIGTTSNAAPGLQINSQSGQQPAIQLNQVNAGDLLDAYQSLAPELLFGNALFHLYTPATFEHNLILDNSSTAAGILQFGSNGSAIEQYTTSSTGSGLSGTPGNAFEFSGPLVTNSASGYYLGASQILGTDSSYQNLYVHTPGNAGQVQFYQNGSGSAYVNLSTTGLLFADGSNYGHNALIQGNLQVYGNTAFTTLSTTLLTVTTVTSPSNGNISIKPGNTNGTVFISADNGSTNQQFNDDGSVVFARGNATIASNGQITSPTVQSNYLSLGSTAGYFEESGAYGVFVDRGGGGFQILNAAGNANIAQFNDSGTGSFAKGAITYDASGTLNTNALNTGVLNATSLGATTISSGDIYTYRSASTGALFFGSNGQHYIYEDGTNLNVTNPIAAPNYYGTTGSVTLCGGINVSCLTVNNSRGSGGADVTTAGTIFAGAANISEANAFGWGSSTVGGVNLGSDPYIAVRGIYGSVARIAECTSVHTACDSGTSTFMTIDAAGNMAIAGNLYAKNFVTTNSLVRSNDAARIKDEERITVLEAQVAALRKQIK